MHEKVVSGLDGDGLERLYGRARFHGINVAMHFVLSVAEKLKRVGERDMHPLEAFAAVATGRKRPRAIV
ncbi:MAG: hypothetical protein RSG96_08265, partial [Clostridia bacterium]